MNIVMLSGTLSSAAVGRELPSGSLLCQLEVTTRGESGAACSVPVSWFDPAAMPDWESGTAVVVLGTVRRRFFRTGGSTQSRTEVVAEAVVAAGDRRAVGRLHTRAQRALGRDSE